MTQETIQWLNQMTLIGQTAKRGNAWHYRASDQAAESNHYTGPIPVEDVKRRLFHWTPAEGDVVSTYLGANDFESVADETRKTMIRPRGTFGPTDTGAVLGVFKDGYQAHDYTEWLINKVGAILDAGLTIGSAGLLKGGAVGWVQCELDETVDTPEGVKFRPFITAATSLDGSLSTTYGRGAQAVVCDNTLTIQQREAERTKAQVKFRHSKRSNDDPRSNDVRMALGLFATAADDFAAQVREQVQTPVSGAEWSRFLKVIAPVKGGEDAETAAKPSISKTLADRRRAELDQLWNYDPRVNLWKGTAFGVVQAVNTWTHHVQKPRGMDRAQRNMTRMVDGDWAKIDGETMAALATAKQLVAAGR